MALVGLVILGLVGFTWPPLLLAWPLALAMVAASIVVSVAIAVDAWRESRLPTGEQWRRVIAARHG